MAIIRFDVRLNDDNEKEVEIKISSSVTGNVMLPRSVSRAKELKEELEEAIEEAEK